MGCIDLGLVSNLSNSFVNDVVNSFHLNGTNKLSLYYLLNRSMASKKSSFEQISDRREYSAVDPKYLPDFTAILYFVSRWSAMSEPSVDLIQA